MPSVRWALVRERPAIRITLQLKTGQTVERTLLSDTAAGSLRAGFELVIRESDSVTAGEQFAASVTLGGAYTGVFPVHWIRVAIPAIQFTGRVRAVSVPNVPPGFDGIACFRFLNRFHYGNSGDPRQFGLER